jgi:N-acylneuraminate cytidylyltransferase
MTHSGLFGGRTRAVLIPPERAVDIDTLLDFTVAECLLARPQPEVPARALP